MSKKVLLMPILKKKENGKRNKLAQANEIKKLEKVNSKLTKSY